MILFFDRNIGTSTPKALRLLGLNVEWHDRHFRPTTYDDVWLSHVGKQGWIVITHDDFLKKKNESEKQALIDHKVGCFLLSGGSADKWSKVRILARAWEKIERLATSEQRPFIWMVYQTGRVRQLYPPWSESRRRPGARPGAR